MTLDETIKALRAGKSIARPGSRVYLTLGGNDIVQHNKKFPELSLRNANFIIDGMDLVGLDFGYEVYSPHAVISREEDSEEEDHNN